MRILIAEKNRSFRAEFVDLITHCHPSWQIVQAADILDLTACLNASRFDVVFLDLDLPGLHAGTDLATLRSENPHSKIIGLGDTNDSATIIRCFEDGLGGYISRTCTGMKLIRTLKVIATPDIFISTGGCEPTRATLLPDRTSAPLADRLPLPALPSREPDSAHTTGAHPLTARQADVLNLLAEGRSTKDIARRLGLAVPTVKTHLAAVYRQLGARNRLQAVVKASALSAPSTATAMRSLSQGELYERTFAAG